MKSFTSSGSTKSLVFLWQPTHGSFSKELEYPLGLAPTATWLCVRVFVTICKILFNIFINKNLLRCMSMRSATVATLAKWWSSCFARTFTLHDYFFFFGTWIADWRLDNKAIQLCFRQRKSLSYSIGFCAAAITKKGWGSFIVLPSMVASYCISF